MTRPTAHAVGWAVFLVASSLAVTVTPTMSYAVRSGTAVVAAGVLLLGARRRDQLTPSRRLFAAALLTAAASGVAAAVHTVLTGHPAQPGSIYDWLALCYVPVAIAGLLAVPGRRGGHARTFADGAIAAGAIWILTLVFVGAPSVLGAGLPATARLTTLGYALLPTFVMSVLLSVLPRSVPHVRPFLVWTGIGMATLSISDLLYALATWHGTYQPTGPIAMLDQVGVGLLLCAALTRLRPTGEPSAARLRAEQQAGSREAALPYVPLVAAIVVVGTRWLGGQGISHAQTLPVLVIACAVVVRHATIVRDHRRLVASLERSEQEAREEALRDPLTGLANRTAFVEGLRAALLDPAAHPVAVALLDLNDFKEVNDSHGHETGDRLLQGCAARLRAVAPLGGLVARLGGDEFALFQPRADVDGRWLVDAITIAFSEPIHVDQRGFAVHPSVGVVVDERHTGRTSDNDAGALLAHADVAMYQAKAAKARHSVATVVLTGESRSRAAALIRMRDEVSDPDLSQFHVVYQPVVRLRDGHIVGAEALLRWRHPELGAVGPVEFIALAEQVGTVGRLGEHVLSTAIMDLARWRAVDPGRRVTVGVNLSALQLTDPELPARALALLQAFGHDPDQLVLEITEGALMDDLDVAVGIVAELRAAGVSVAVDDFGTGYSSLRYLRRFPVDVVKIDREFVQAAAAEPRTAALVRSVVDMATALDLETVAEGIETVEQLRACQRLGCAVGQGYLFSRPVDADAIIALIASGERYAVCTSTEAATAGRPWEIAAAGV